MGGDGARDLRDFKRMRQTIPEMIGIAAGKNLGLGLKPSKGAGMDNAIAVTLKIIAVRMLRLRITPAARLLHMDRVGSEELNH